MTDRLFCHGSISRPFAASNCDQTVITEGQEKGGDKRGGEIKKESTHNGDKKSLPDINDVVPSEGLGVSFLWIIDQRTDSTPTGSDVPTPNNDVIVEVLFNLAQNKRNILKQ